MFQSEYSYKLDDKGRVPVPPKFREELKDGIVLIPNPKKYIIGYTPAKWKIISESLQKSALESEKMRTLNRALFSAAFTVNLDGQGRIALPVPLRTFAGIGEDVVIAGANTCLEIWDKQLWEEEKTNSLAQAWKIIETLENH
jgi:MraZ protein